MKQFRDTSYYISRDGNVYSDKPSGLKKLKLQIDKKGYFVIGLYMNNHQQGFKVHRLVAECYIPNIDNKLQVNHLNGIKTDNRIENLEWVSNQENRTHSSNNELHKKGSKHPKSKLTVENIKFIKQNYIPKHSEFGGIALSKKFNVSNKLISKIITNKRHA